jgi:hypothetical protein
MPPYPGMPGYPAVPKNSGKAIAALVCGILSLICCGIFAAIPAIILGVLGRREIDASGGIVTGRGMATAGLVLGIIGIVLSVITVILLVAGTFSSN